MIQLEKILTVRFHLHQQLCYILVYLLCSLDPQTTQSVSNIQNPQTDRALL